MDDVWPRGKGGGSHVHRYLVVTQTAFAECDRRPLNSSHHVVIAATTFESMLANQLVRIAEATFVPIAAEGSRYVLSAGDRLVAGEAVAQSRRPLADQAGGQAEHFMAARRGGVPCQAEAVQAATISRTTRSG